jgi:outer membrane immunogenic protein
MKRIVIVIGVLLFVSTAFGQETRNEISVQGTGFFTRDTNHTGIAPTSTNSGGVLAGYRFRLNRWLSAESNYGYTRNTQLFSGVTNGRAQADVHAVTGDVLLNLPLVIGKFSPYVLAGGGSLTFRPTDNGGGALLGAATQTQGAFLYGVGTDYGLTRHLALRAEYRGFVYKAPDFGVAGLNNDTWTHSAQPSAGIVVRF